jgi:hypothetical protein
VLLTRHCSVLTLMCIGVWMRFWIIDRSHNDFFNRLTSSKHFGE